LLADEISGTTLPSGGGGAESKCLQMGCAVVFVTIRKTLLSIFGLPRSLVHSIFMMSSDKRQVYLEIRHHGNIHFCDII